ncbi:MAG TPA: RnfABCDGE type electron transport complex subunit D [Clostridiales bacterium]|nr:RnfABCDGE type electron transport complex subunit D [Clostridiales bacterium]
MNQLIVSSSPHINSDETIAKIMRDVVIALIPAGIAAIYFFGSRALLIIVVSVISAVLTEWFMQKLYKKPITLDDWSAVVTGILIAYNMPPTVPLWLPIVGSVIAIAIIKQSFGGLGQNFMNPALGARAILLACWPVRMTTWVAPGPDAISTATPLELLNGNMQEGFPTIWDAFIGNIGGCIGETSAFALILGAIYLLYRDVINWRIPVSYLGTVALFTWIFGKDGFFTGNGIYNLFIGGLMLGAFYMATDYATSPVTPKGQLIMGFGCGIITSIIRLYGGYPDGVTYAILIMNIVTPLIDRYTIPSIYGEVERNV